MKKDGSKEAVDRAQAALAALSFHSESIIRENEESLEEIPARASDAGADNLLFESSMCMNADEMAVLKDKPEEELVIPESIAIENETKKLRERENGEAIGQRYQDTFELSLLERLTPELSSLVLSHLSLQEISQTSLASCAMRDHSRTDELWRLKFTARWNARFVTDCCKTTGSWLESFKHAFANPHDLWMTHWNCVYPDDSDSPGRCCIPGNPTTTLAVDVESSVDDGYRSFWMEYCPTCRYQSGSSGLPSIVRQAMDMEYMYACGKSETDPIADAETVAAAHGLLLNDPSLDGLVTTRARTTFATTQLSIAKFCRQAQPINGLERKSDGSSVQEQITRAEKAFECSSTFHRHIGSKQYLSTGLHFLTDVVFFNLERSKVGPYKECPQGEDVTKDLYGEIIDSDREPAHSGTACKLGPRVETANHTWHVVRLSNPDFIRPLSFRIFVQRQDCFTAFPSEGYLEPGRTCHIVLGVRPLGSLLSKSFEALNVEREEVDPFLADVYSEEAHLPFAPFVVRYMFAPVTPCIPPTFTSRGDVLASQTFVRPTWTQAASSKYKHVVEYLWSNVATESDVRTQYLSAHVNANYSFYEFQRNALFPFDLHVRDFDEWASKDELSCEPLVFVAPQIREKEAKVFDVFHNLREIEVSDAGVSCRTEKSCAVCGQDWGHRAEELGRAHILRKMTCEAESWLDRRQTKNVRDCVRLLSHILTDEYIETRMVCEGYVTELYRIYELLYSLHGFLIGKRGSRFLELSQREMLMRLEFAVDDLCVKVHESLVTPGENFISVNKLVVNDLRNAIDRDPTTVWRNSGVYQHLTCTDSVFEAWARIPTTRGMGQDSALVSDLSQLKDEPDYLEGFRYLCHSPGLLFLGRQEDPNHDVMDTPMPQKLRPALNRRFYRQTWDRHTDIYMDNPMFAFASALSMIHDPRSLLVHGLYDRIRGPGTLVRRPLIPTRWFSETKRKCNYELYRDAKAVIGEWRQRWMRRSVATKPRRQEKPAYGLLGTRKVCLQLNDGDLESHRLLHFSRPGARGVCIAHLSSWRNYLNNIPAPGMGKFLLCEAADGPESDVVPVSIYGTDEVEVSETEVDNDGLRERHRIADRPRRVDNDRNDHNAIRNAAIRGHIRGPRLLNFLFLLSAQLGWTVDESQGPGSTLVDRRILIATQWVSNSLMALPLIITLIARFTLVISPKPIDYHLEGLPFEVDSGMRYITGIECVTAALTVASLWLIMGRYAERRIGRSFERALLEHVSSNRTTNELRFSGQVVSRCMIWLQTRWDRMCPLFLQRLVFTPRWNRRSSNELLKHIALWRSRDLLEHRSVFNADRGQGVKTDRAGSDIREQEIDTSEESASRKLLVCVLISLGSFCSSSPHFLLNLLTVFCCSIGLGMSMSLQSMELGRGMPSAAHTRRLLKPFGLNTLVIAFFLVGQLVGSSGGVLFLAEFMVTSVSLVLGGAGTISAAAMESWAVFSILSSTAFWGYLVARVALIDAIRRKKRGTSSIVLCVALLLATGLWIGALSVWEWELPPALMIVRSSFSKEARRDRKYVSHQLQ